MAEVDVVNELSPARRSGIDEFLTTLSRSVRGDGRPGHECERLDDHLLLDLRHGPRPGFVAALAHDGERLVGYAQASTSARGHVVDSVVAPDAGEHLRADLLRPLLDALPADSHVTWWAHDDDRRLAESLGLSSGRRLLQMRVDLPLDVPHEQLATRSFVVGEDEAEWLEVNNAAFAWHHEQGAWDLDTIQQRELEPWFDPQGFRVLEMDGRIAGFCWTKVHAAAEPQSRGPVGEIYVVAVHPTHRGTGLGRALTLAGIDHLERVGARACMLYVDADNAPAVGVYAALGFHAVHAEQAFVRDGTHDSASRPR
ncbi:MAG: mycothiol synthase [Ilumatobacteraceae bacterium]